MIGHVIGLKGGAASGKETKGTKADFFHIGYKDLLEFTADEREVKVLVVNILTCIQTQLKQPTFPFIVKHTKKAQTALIQLWEKLLRIRAGQEEERDRARGGGDTSDSEDNDGDGGFFKSSQSTIAEALLSLQKILDIPNFLVTTKVLIEGTGVGDASLCRRSLIVLSERVAAVEVNSGEYVLVLEFIQEVVEFISEAGEEDDIEVAMTALAIIVNNLRQVEKHTDTLKLGLKVMCSVIKKGTTGADEPSGAAVGTCVEALLRKLGAKGLPHLDGLMKAAKLGWSKVVCSVIKFMPMFVARYLDDIMKLWLKGGDDALREATVEFIELRLIVPVLYASFNRRGEKAGGVGTEDARKCLLLLISALKKSDRKDVAPVFEDLVDLVISGYRKCGNGEGLLEECNDALLAVVMKQNEKQLRAIYRRLEELRDEAGEQAKKKGLAELVFWSATLKLSSTLKGIFLPLLNADEVAEVLGRAAKKDKKRKRSNKNDDDLNGAAKTVKIKANANGKVRATKGMANGNGHLSHQVELTCQEPDVKLVKVVLKCLDEGLKSDGFAGGAWCQAQEARRYNLLLKQLSGLLLLDLGIGEEVSACIVNLAAAGGSEILWKPLNHAVLEACSATNGTVKKVGLSCLLQILQVIREEYLGILPECLPVLSEMLEDDSKEVVNLARQVVALAEEISGEPLDEFLN